MDKNSEIFEIELYGPIGKWFGVLFDSHKGGDAVIYTTDYDGLDTAGVNVDYSVKSKSSADITKDAIQNWNVIELTQVNGKQKIVAWRNFNTGDVDNDYIIDYNTNTLTLLVAYSGSNELTFGYHGSNFWKVTIDLSETVITSTPTTSYPIITTNNLVNQNVSIKTFPLTQIGDGSGIFVSITMNKITEIYEIELHGPTDRWFGVVWDNHYAGEAFIYVLDGTNPDYICSGKSFSDIIQDPVQNWNVHQNIVINGQRQILASRAFDTGDTTNDYPFDFTKNSVTLLVAHGVDNGPLSYHSSYRWVADVIFDGANVTIPRVTEFIDPNATVKVFPKTEIGYNSGIEIAIKMDKNSEIFEIELLGPIGKWFGVLFDSHNGGDSLIYTSGYDGLDTAGVNVDYSVKSIFADDIKKDDIQNWNVTELSQIDGKQKIVAWRKFNTGDMDNDYIIDYNANTLTLLIAHCDEDSLIFGSHGQYKWKDVIDLAAGTNDTDIDSIISEDETSLMPITMDEENVDIKMFELSEIGDDSGIFVSITMKQSTETYEIELHGPTDRWFGIIWNNHYAGDAFIYVLDGSDPDYKCSGKAESDLIKDTIQSWIIHENIEINGQRQIVASRAFDTGDREHDYPFDFMQNSVNLLVAHGVDSSDSLSYHGSYRWEATINMLSGGLLEKSIETYYLLNHEIFMLIGFGIIVPFALLLFRFKLIFFQCYSSFWIIQIVRSMFVLGTISVWFGLIEKIFHGIEENNLILFDTIHSYIGLILISIWSLSMILQYILYRNKKEHEFRLFDNPISCIFIILLCFGQITLGLIQVQISKVYFMIFIVYCGIYVVIYIMLEIYQGSLLHRLIKRRTSKFQFEINLAKISINNNNKADTNIKSDITSPNSTMSPLNSPQQNTNELFTTPNIIHVQTSDDDENFEEKQLEDYHVGDYDEQYEVYYD